MRESARRRYARRLAQLARLAGVCLLISSMAGVAPLAMSRTAPTPKCGDMCSRCHCAGHSGSAGLRAPCPCCAPTGGAHDGIAADVAAIIDDGIGVMMPPLVSDALAPFVSRGPTVARAVPHPPPRTPLPA